MLKNPRLRLGETPIPQIQKLPNQDKKYFNAVLKMKINTKINAKQSKYQAKNIT